MTDKRNEQECLLLDSRSTPLAHCVLLGPANAPQLQVRILDGKEDEVAQHALIQLLGMGSISIAVQCQILRQRDEILFLSVVDTLDPKIRRNLRVPVNFKSFIYPLSGAWRGRREIQSIDISCGGLAFYGSPGLEKGERLEAVIPIMARPLVLCCQILRSRELRDDRSFYAAEFVDMCNDEETLLRETVFHVQLSERPKRLDRERTREET